MKKVCCLPWVNGYLLMKDGYWLLWTVWLGRAFHQPAVQELLPAAHSALPQHSHELCRDPGPCQPWGSGLHAQQRTGGSHQKWAICYFSARPWYDISVHPWQRSQKRALAELPSYLQPFAHLFMPTMHPGLAAIESLAACEITLRSTFSHLHLILLKEEQKSRVCNSLAFLSMNSHAHIYYSHEPLW